MNIENWNQTDKSTHESQKKRDGAPGAPDQRGELHGGKHEKARGEKPANDQKTATKEAPSSSAR